MCAGVLPHTKDMRVTGIRNSELAGLGLSGKWLLLFLCGPAINWGLAKGVTWAPSSPSFHMTPDC